MKLEPSIFAAPLLRAIVRISILLFPAIRYLYKSNRKEDVFSFHTNWQRGLFAGAIVAIIFLLPLCLYRLQTQSYTLQIPSAGAIWLNWIIGSPAAEELYFRVLLLDKFQAVWKTPVAIAMSAVCFGLFHVPQWVIENGQQEWWQITSFIVVIGYGVIFAVLFRLTKSLWGALIPHIANNLVAVSLVANTT